MHTKEISYLFLIPFCIIVTNGCETCKNSYVPPGNMRHPYGDEYLCNMDIMDEDINPVVCENLAIKEFARCPYPPEDPNDLKLTEPYVACPEFSLPPVIGENPPGVTLGSNEAICKGCDVKLSQDSNAVDLMCTECFDLPSLSSTRTRTRDLLFTTYFIEIANYTSVKVEGREHFNA